MPLSLHARMLRACELTYDVRPGSLNAHAITRDRGKQVGLEGVLHVIGRNGDRPTTQRDLAFVGAIDDALIVAIRGTQEPEITPDLPRAGSIAGDWLNDGDVFGQLSDDFGGLVHQGFAEAATALFGKVNGTPGILDRVNERAGAAGAPSRIIVTGHSKGGPVAQLVAFLLRQSLADAAIEVVTFAAARLGNAAFNARFNAANIACQRYETHYDIVPKLPLGGETDPDLIAIVRALGFDGAPGAIGFVPLGHEVIETAAVADALGSDPANPRSGLFGRLPVGPIGAIARAVRAHTLGENSHYDRLLATRAVR